MKKYWKYHLILALVLVTLELLEDFFLKGIDGLLSNFTLRHFISGSIFFFTAIVIYTVNFKLVCPNFLLKNKVLKIVLGFGLLIVLFSSIRFFLEEVIVFYITGNHNYYLENLTALGYLGDNYFFAVKPIIYSTTIFFVIKNKEKRELTFRLQLAKSKAELDLLKSQISPHFLFNTLNSFYVELIDEKPDTADDIQRLSELLRHVIYDSKGDFITLDKEIRFLQDYVHFFRKRYEDNLFVDFIIDGNSSTKKIPSLTLINFVENLFKHGIVNDKNDVALIHLKIEEKFIILKTRNKKNNSDKLMHSGIGNKNVQKRLDVLFPNNEYKLDFSDENNYFETTLKIPV
jgi:sensor histidine kinase YesM